MLLRRLVMVLFAVVLAACGEENPPPAPPRLTDAERRQLQVLEGRIETHCVRVAQSLVDPEAAPTPREEAEAFKAADDLVTLAERKPTAPVDVGQDVRLLLSDVTENLEGSNCDPRMIARLERGLARIPVE